MASDQNNDSGSTKRVYIHNGAKSGKSRTQSFVKFTNKTDRIVDIIWLNFEGIGVKYKTLTPKQFVDVNTFVGHPWIFRDGDSGDKLVVNYEEVYDPPSFTLENGQFSPSHRINCDITIPVYPLKERCLQILRWIIPKDQIKYLEIPRTLQIDLMEYFTDFVSTLTYSQRGNVIMPNPLLHRLDNPSDLSERQPPAPTEQPLDDTHCNATHSLNNNSEAGCSGVESTMDQDTDTECGTSKTYQNSCEEDSLVDSLQADAQTTLGQSSDSNNTEN